MFQPQQQQQQQQQQRRGNFYDMHCMPYRQQPQPHYFNGGFFPYHHPMMEAEFQRSRPTKLTPRVLNRRFKKVTIQLNDGKVLLVSVNVGKGNKPFLVFSQCEGSYENKTNSVSIPESLVVPFIQQLHKLSKWRPSTSGHLPTSQALNYDDSVFRTQVVCLSDAATVAEVPQESRLYAIKILAEARARDPADRKELASVSIPLETSHLMKVKEALNDVIVAVAESPLYHTKSLQGADGSKFYLDMIREDDAHYLKLSQVTRDFRSILHVPAEDLEAFKELLDASLKAMKGQQATEEPSKAGGGGKKRRSRQGRRRPNNNNNNKRSDAGSSSNNNNKGSQSNSDCDEAAAVDADAKEPEKKAKDQQEEEKVAAETEAADSVPHPTPGGAPEGDENHDDDDKKPQKPQVEEEKKEEQQQQQQN